MSKLPIFLLHKKTILDTQQHRFHNYGHKPLQILHLMRQTFDLVCCHGPKLPLNFSAFQKKLTPFHNAHHSQFFVSQLILFTWDRQRFLGTHHSNDNQKINSKINFNVTAETQTYSRIPFSLSQCIWFDKQLTSDLLFNPLQIIWLTGYTCRQNSQRFTKKLTLFHKTPIANFLIS